MNKSLCRDGIHNHWTLFFLNDEHWLIIKNVESETIDLLKLKEITNYYCNYCLCHRHTVCIIFVIEAVFFLLLTRGFPFHAAEKSRDRQTLIPRPKKKKKKGIHRHIICMSLLLRPCELHEQSIFSWQILFTSKFKNTHPHLEDMPSRSPCDLFGAHLWPILSSMWSAALSLLQHAGTILKTPRLMDFKRVQMHVGSVNKCTFDLRRILVNMHTMCTHGVVKRCMGSFFFHSTHEMQV